MKLAILAFSRRGCAMALRARESLYAPRDECRCFAPETYAEGPFEPITPPCTQFTGPLFAWADALVFVGAAGIAVRSIAPYVRDKRTDPAVLCVDERGGFVVPLLSGHIGGANELARRLAGALGAVPVVTTATDINGKFSVDAWAARQGLIITDLSAAKAVSAAILEDTVPLCCDAPLVGELPPGTTAGDSGALGVCISWRRKKPFAKTLLLVPPVLHLGLGCRLGATSEAIREAVRAENGCWHSAIMHSTNVRNMSRAAKALNTTIFVKNAPSYSGLGMDAEGYATLTIATPTGEGLTSARTFTRARRCVLHDDFRII